MHKHDGLKAILKEKDSSALSAPINNSTMLLPLDPDAKKAEDIVVALSSNGGNMSEV